MRKQSRSMSVLAFFIAFIAVGLFFAGMTRTVHAAPPEKPEECDVCEELDEIPPTWSQKLPASARFKLVFPIRIGDILWFAAVLDKETGLVWDLSPGTEHMYWYEACYHCYNKVVGGRKGWRLPTIEELTSLVDTTNTDLALPTGHPFINVQSIPYWSSTASINTNVAWYVHFSNNGVVGELEKGQMLPVWCVRGGYGRHDTY